MGRTVRTATLSASPGFQPMGESLKAHHLRQLLRIAHQLRRSADGTDDAYYVGLFIKTAEAVEFRAAEIANAPGDDPAVSEAECVGEAAAPRYANLLVQRSSRLRAPSRPSP